MHLQFHKVCKPEWVQLFGTNYKTEHGTKLKLKCLWILSLYFHCNKWKPNKYKRKRWKKTTSGFEDIETKRAQHTEDDQDKIGNKLYMRFQKYLTAPQQQQSISTLWWGSRFRQSVCCYRYTDLYGKKRNISIRKRLVPQSDLFSDFRCDFSDSAEKKVV